MRLFTRSLAQPELGGPEHWHNRLEEECRRAARRAGSFLVVLIEADAGEVLCAPVIARDPRIVVLRLRTTAPIGRLTAQLSNDEMAVVASGLRHAVRDRDLICRLSPSRFGVLLRDASPELAYPICIRLTGEIRSEVVTQVPSLQGFGLHFGYAAYTEETNTPAALIEAAERDLYERWAREQHDAGA